MPNRRNAWIALAALLLGACSPDRAPEAPPEPPQLRIVQPRPGTRVPIWDDVRQLGWIEVLFDLDDPTGTHRIRFAVGDGAPTEVRDRHRALVRKPVRGTHRLRAWLVDAPGATAEITIHVGDASEG